MPESREKSLFEEFIESTTLHGIRNVFSDGSKFRRSIWFLCVCCCLTIFIFNFIGLMTSYLNNEVVSRITVINQDDAKFPAVTICNFNPIRLRYLRHLHLWLEKPSNNEDLDQNSPDKMDNMTAFFRNAGHQIEDMLLNCTLQGKRCRPDDFDYVLTNMGGCFTFDFEKRLETFGYIVSSGENYGLTMTLNVELNEYDADNAQAVGFKVLVHEKDEFPLVEDNGFAIMPGVSTFAAIKKNKVKKLPPMCENKERIGKSLYTKPFCYETCRRRYVAKQCGCYYIAAIADLPPCTLRQLFGCVDTKSQAFSRLPKKNCSCPQSCEVNSYDITLSYGVFTTSYDNDLYLDDIKDSEYYHKLMMMNHVRDNYAQIKIFFHDLNFHLVEDIRKYNIHTLLSAAGGMLGLLLGASVITLAEFLDFFISLFKIKWSQTKVTTIN